MKKIILGVSGSIAAYKSLQLVRAFIKKECEVRVVMTPSATQFVTALSFATLSKHAVNLDVADKDTWNNHVELGLWADAMVIAPATASTISKMASGLANNMLIATYLSAKCPVFVAPAMDLDMWKHPSTKQNLDLLRNYGNYIIPVGYGELASGLIGDGRMAEPDDILAYLDDYTSRKDDLKEKKVMITAGPTFEPIDPVRYIGNHSSGLMGICLAEECARRGAQVDLILGPTHLSTQMKGIKTVQVTTANEMYEASLRAFPGSQVAILAAAVSDYRPLSALGRKIKKKEGQMQLTLDPTHDIAAILGGMKQKDQVTIGFALETNDEVSNARKKLENKNFDFIVLNSLRDKGAGFKSQTNKISILSKDNKIQEYQLKSKQDVASDIVDELINLLDSTS